MVVPRVNAVEFMMEIVNEISGIREYKSVVKKDCANLTKRVKLLAPMFEEVKEINGTLPQETMVVFASLFIALQSAKQLLKRAIMGQLDKIEHEVVARPPLDNGLGRLPKSSTFNETDTDVVLRRMAVRRSSVEFAQSQKKHDRGQGNCYCQTF
eukprot:Gb_00534 [translate_table: standard]